MNLIRDKETGKSKGFAFLKYEDQHSTDLAVDNLGGATVLGRVLKVDHTRYKRKDDDEELEREQMFNKQESGARDAHEGRPISEEDNGPERPLLKKERELAALIRDHDEDDPMKEYLIQEKKEQVAKALSKLAKKDRKSSERKKHRHHHRHHRSRRASLTPESNKDRLSKNPHLPKPSRSP